MESAITHNKLSLSISPVSSYLIVIILMISIMAAILMKIVSINMMFKILITALAVIFSVLLAVSIYWTFKTWNPPWSAIQQNVIISFYIVQSIMTIMTIIEFVQGKLNLSDHLISLYIKW